MSNRFIICLLDFDSFRSEPHTMRVLKLVLDEEKSVLKNLRKPVLLKPCLTWGGGDVKIF